MNEKDAWKRFMKTGAVQDYLAYCRERRSQEEDEDAGDHRRTDHS